MVELGEKKMEIKKAYYDKKILLLERKNELILRQVIALENQTSVVEKIQLDIKDIAANHII